MKNALLKKDQGIRTFSTNITQHQELTSLKVLKLAER